MERIPEGEAIAKMEDARRYNEVMGKGPVQHEYRELARLVAGMGVPDGGVVLDVGTGPGFVAMEIARELEGKARVVGLDLSAAMLAVAAENARRNGLEDVVTFREGDASAMPFEDGEFDFVVSSGSLHHWDDPVPVFDEVARVLKPGGGFVIQDMKRVQSWGSRLFAWAIGMTIPSDFRVHYWGSIRSAYIAEELRQVVGRSRLEGWEIDEDIMGLRVLKAVG